MPRAQPTPLETASKQWGQRISQLAPQLQKNPAALKGIVDIAVKDIQGVARGSSAMTNEEALNAVTSITGQHDLVHKHHGTGGVLGTILNIPKDIGQTALSLPAGLYNFVHHLPSEITNTGQLVTHLGNDQWLQQHHYEAIKDPGAFLRDVAKSPILDTIPGVDVAAKLTTAQGREQLQQHPVQAFLDVLPYMEGPLAHLGGQLASFTELEAANAGVAGEEAVNAALKLQGDIHAGKISPEDAAAHPAYDNLQKLKQNFKDRKRFNSPDGTAGVFHLAPRGSVTEALMRGNPIHAAMRWADDYGLPKLGLKPDWFHSKVEDLLQSTTGGRFTMENVRNKAIAERVAAKEFRDFNAKVRDLIEIRDARGKVIRRRTGAEMAYVKSIMDRIANEGDPKLYYKALENDRGVLKGFVEEAPGKFATEEIPSEVLPLVNAAKNLSLEIISKDDTYWKMRVGDKEIVYGSSAPEQALRKLRDEYQQKLADRMRLSRGHNEFRRQNAIHLRQQLEKRRANLQRLLDRATARGGETASQLSLLGGERPFVSPQLERIANIRAGLNTVDAALRQVSGLSRNTTGYQHLDLNADVFAGRHLPGFTEAETGYRKAGQEVAGFQQRLKDGIANTRSTAHEGVMGEMRRQAMLDHLKVEVGPKAFHNPTQEIAEKIHQIQEGRGTPFSVETMTAINRDVETTVRELEAQGFNPIWLPKVGEVDLRRMDRGSIVIGGNSPLKAAFDYRPSVHNAAVQLELAAWDSIRRRALDQFYQQSVMPHVRTWAQIRDGVAQQAAGRLAGETRVGFDNELALKSEALRMGWQLYNPETHAFSVPDIHNINETDLLAPREIVKGIDHIINGYGWEKSGFSKITTKSTNVMKVSVMTLSPKHLAHILFGGMFFILAGGGKEEILSALKAFRMVKGGEMPVELSQTGYGIDESILNSAGQPPEKMLEALRQEGNPIKTWNYLGGRTAGRIWTSLGNGVDQIRKFEDFIGNVQRTMSYLGEESRALKKGYTPEMARNMGLRHAEKMLVDFDGMSPIEKTIIRQVFPFYAYTRHIVRYALTFPIDHPLRASILSRIAAQEQEHWNSDLPEQWQRLFFLGAGGGLGSVPKHGQVTALDVRAINPFRDLEKTLTLAGFVQALNPLAQVFLRGALHYDPASGGTELYPHLIVDPLTGSMKAAPQKDFPIAAIGTFVPEIGSLDYLFQWSDKMRNLAQSDPNAFHSQLFSSLMTPGYNRYNIDIEKAAVSKRYLQEAQRAVSDVAGGKADPSTLLQYDFVPFQGQLVPAQIVASIYSMMLRITGGQVAPRAITPRKAPTFKRRGR